jgi:hypothetical protein
LHTSNCADECVNIFNQTGVLVLWVPTYTQLISQ